MRVRELAVSDEKSRITLDGLREEIDSGAEVWFGAFAGPSQIEECFAARVKIERPDIRRRLPLDLRLFRRRKFRTKLIRDLLRDLTLDDENIRHVVIEILGPNLGAVLRID